MSLQVWLPLTGHLNNQGLVALPNPAYNGITFSESGKVGKYYGKGRACWHLSQDILDNQWSVALWYYNSSGASTDYSATGNSILFCKNSADMPNAQIYLSIFQKNKLNICANDGNNTTALQYTYAFARDTWYHFATTFDGTNLKLYLNGSLVASKTTTAAKKTGCLNICVDGRAAIANGTTCDYGTNGLYNDVRLYDNAISEKEVKMLSHALALHYPLSGVNNTLLPFGYEQLEYVESAGNAYINTGYKFNPEVESFEVGYKSNVTSHNGMILATAVGASAYFWLYYYGSSGLRIYTKTSSTAQENIVGASNDLVKHVVKYKNKHMYVDEVDKGSLSSTYAQISHNLFLFSDSAQNTYTFKGRIYYCYIYNENNKAQRIYIPAKRISDSAIGMYDIVNYEFLTSATSTAFTAGSIVNTPNIIYDVSGHQYNGNATTGIIVNSNSARYNYCLQFNGTNTYITETSFTKLITVYTIALWIYHTQNSNYQTLVCSRNITGGGLSIFITPDHKLRIDSGINADSSLQWTTNYTVPNNEWHHLVIIRNNTSSVKYYIDGILKETKTITYTDKYGTVLSVGASQYNGSSYGNYFNGCMSDLRIYRTALSDADVKELYNTAASLANNGTLFAYDFVEA